MHVNFHVSLLIDTPIHHVPTHEFLVQSLGYAHMTASSTVRSIKDRDCIILYCRCVNCISFLYTYVCKYVRCMVVAAHMSAIT